MTAETIGACWARYELGAVLAGKRAPFAIANAPASYECILQVLRTLRRSALPFDCDRVALLVELHTGRQGILSELHRSIAYRSHVLSTVREYGPLVVILREFDRMEAVRAALEERIAVDAEKRRRVLREQARLVDGLRKVAA